MKSSPFMVNNCQGNLFRGINITRQSVLENHLSGAKSPDNTTYCPENKKTEKQNIGKNCTHSPEMETSPVYEYCCSFD